MSKEFKFIIFIVFLFIVIQKFIGVVQPWPRLALFPFFILMFLYRQQFDQLLTKSLQNINVKKFIKTIFILLVLFRSGGFIRKLIKPVKGEEDIARVYKKSITTLFRYHKNPYKEQVDSYPITINGRTVDFTGPKYPPLQIILYAPFVLPFGIKGIYIGNFFAYLAMLLGVIFILKRESTTKSLLGGALFLSTDYFFTKAFNKGINDYIPTAFIFLSIISINFNKRKTSGILLGLSSASKQLPAGIFLLIYLFQKRFQEAIIGSLIFIIITIPFLLNGGLSPFINNTIIFNLFRPPRFDSFIFYVPKVVGQIITALSILTILYFAWRGRAKESLWSIKDNWILPTLSIIWFLLFAKMSPSHYFIWVYPFFIIWYLSKKKQI